jgi:patatin-related protein
MAQRLDQAGQDGRSAALTDFDMQDIRVAVVMNGGVSLAIWISGVTLELHHLALARGEPPNRLSVYREVLDLLGATARIDVIAGTSAGGLNGAFLALGLARGRDLHDMRDLWKDHGGLEKLLRDPLVKDPPSLLRGDEYFQVQVGSALQRVLEGPPLDPDGSAASVLEEPLAIELLLTGTLWDGRVSTFTDDMNTAITERDYDATFRFSSNLPDRDGASRSGDLNEDGVVAQLAAAARCTSSFPAAFEPHWVEVDGDVGPDGRRPSDAGRVNFSSPQYVVDGGVLLNKPLRPALEAIYRQPAGLQVRRVFAYVVPHPGEPTAATVLAERPDLPTAQTVLLSVLTRMRSTDSVARELTEIRTRNDAAASRRGARVRLATAMTETADPLSTAAWPGYLRVRKNLAARRIAGLFAEGQPATGRWSERELAAALGELPMPFIPEGDELKDALRRSGEQWNWGQTTVSRLGEMTLDLLRRAVWLAPIGSEAKARIVGCRRAVHDTLQEIRADQVSLDDYWRAAPAGNPAYGTPPIPERAGGTNQPAENPRDLDAWLGQILGGWERVAMAAAAAPAAGAADQRRTRQYGQALTLAGHLRQCADAISEVCDHPNMRLDPDEPGRLLALYKYVLLGASRDEEVLQRMLRLDVVQLSFAGAAEEVQQQVELVQVSAHRPERLTGVQEHHFGAFYRPSWRVNDWLHGRMDGAEQIIRLLLSPERLRQLGDNAPTLDELRAAAIGNQDDPDHDWLLERWREQEGECAAELRAAVGKGPLPTALPRCSEQIARRIQTRILSEDLPALAVAIREDSDAPKASQGWLSVFDAGGGRRTAATLWDLWEKASGIGSQRIRNEVGSDTFARTAAQVTSVAANTAGTLKKPRTVAAVLGAFRGYALTVWAMIHFLALGRFGTRAVEIALAAGGVLLAVTILVPGIPLGLTLFGVLLLLAGLTAAALQTPPGSRAVGRRLLAATVLVAVALAAYLWWDFQRNGSNAVAWTLLAKVAVALVIVLLGLWIAQAQRPAGQRARQRAGPGPRQ